MNWRAVMNKEELTPTPLQALEEIYNVFRKDVWYETVYSKQYEIIKKSLKALEIIKEKRVNVFALKTTNTLKEYNNVFIGNYCDRKTRKLKKEEYDLLKEMLK